MRAITAVVVVSAICSLPATVQPQNPSPHFMLQSERDAMARASWTSSPSTSFTPEGTRAGPVAPDSYTARRAMFSQAMDGMKFRDLAHYNMYFRSAGGIAPNAPIPAEDQDLYLQFMPPNVRKEFQPGFLQNQADLANKNLFVDRGGGTEAEWDLAMAPDIKPGQTVGGKTVTLTRQVPPPPPPKPGSDEYVEAAVKWMAQTSANTNFNGAKIKASLKSGLTLMVKRRTDGTRVAALARDAAAIRSYETNGFSVWAPPQPPPAIIEGTVQGVISAQSDMADEQKRARKKVKDFQAKTGKFMLLPTGEVGFMMPSAVAAWWPFSFDVKYAIMGLSAALMLLIVLRVVLLAARIRASAAKKKAAGQTPPAPP